MDSRGAAPAPQERNRTIAEAANHAVHSRGNLLRGYRWGCRRGIAVAARPGSDLVIAGHFGFAAGVKAAEQQTPLWTLMLGTVWLDIVFVPLFMIGIETIEPVVDMHGGYGGNIIHADYTHSLVGAAALSAIFGAAFGLRWGLRSGVVLGLMSFSHWVLDLIVHHADMPLLPGDIGHFPKFGFGLWQVPQATIGIEAALVVAGAWLYYRAGRSVTRAAGRGAKRATIASLLILLGGLIVLALDVSGIVG